MSRVYCPYREWPEADRQAWQAAIANGDVLDGRGPAYRWRQATRKTNVQHYSRWLGFWENKSTLSKDPAERVTKANVKAYVEHLKVSVAPRTVVSSLIGLKVMMKAMAPDRDWRWLADICNRLNRNSAPIKDKRSRISDSGNLYRTALRYLDRLGKTDLTKRVELVGYRNAFMVALLTACPLRLKNFSSLAVGMTLLKSNGSWMIKIAGSETKNGDPLEYHVPERLAPYLTTYLERVRSKIANIAETALWVSWDGDRMPYHTVYVAFTRITRQLFGKEINPHLFRDCAATTLASKSLKTAMAAPGILGHRRHETTEKYYIHARQLEASRMMNGILCLYLRSESRSSGDE